MFNINVYNDISSLFMLPLTCYYFCVHENKTNQIKSYLVEISNNLNNGMLTNI